MAFWGHLLLEQPGDSGGAAVDAEPSVNLGPVIVKGVMADAQNDGNFLVALVGGTQFKDFPFAGRERALFQMEHLGRHTVR